MLPMKIATSVQSEDISIDCLCNFKWREIAREIDIPRHHLNHIPIIKVLDCLEKISQQNLYMNHVPKECPLPRKRLQSGSAL